MVVVLSFAKLKKIFLSISKGSGGFMKKHPRWCFYAIIMIGFLLTLYWVEGSSWSSREVAKYNGGYGTFDMKNYDVHAVEHVLATMDSDGYNVSYRYYVGDYLFTIFFGLLQCMIVLIIYNPLRMKLKIARMMLVLSVVVLVLRGMADLVENTLLVFTLLKYPNIHPNIIQLASTATIIKLSCIKIWGLLMIVGLAMRFIWKLKNMSNKICY